MTKRRKQALRVALIGAAAFGFIYAVLLWGSGLALRRACEALERDGRPMDASAVVPPKAADADNAALVYESVLLHLKAEKDEQKGDLFTYLNALAHEMDDPTPAAIEELRELICRRTVSDALARIERGAEKPACRFNIDYSRGWYASQSHLSGMMMLARIVCAAARVQAADGDSPRAWRTVMTGLNLADATQKEPLLMSQVTRANQVIRVIKTLQYLCEAAPPNAEQTQALQNTLRSFDDVRPLVDSIDGTRLLVGEWAFAQPAELRKVAAECGRNGALMLIESWCRPLLQTDHAAFLNIMHTYAQMAGQPYSIDGNKRADEMPGQIPRYCRATRFLVPEFSLVKTSYDCMIARVRIGQAGLSVLLHKQNKGSFPPTLADCNAQNLKDPFTGNALMYRIEGKGFVVYSTGEDQKDDGGDGGDRKDRRGKDIVWRHRGGPETEAEPAADAGKTAE